MYPSSLPPLKVPGGQSNATRTSNTLWALRPSAALWNRIPSQSNPIFRARHMLNKLLHSPAQELISWSTNNVIAVASSEPCNSIENISHESQSGLSWPLYLILPDHPSDVYLVKEYYQRLKSVNWNPGNGNQLLVASSTKISVFTPSVENTVNILEIIQEFDTQPLLLANWVHVPIKYKVETPNTNVWNESFSFGRKFGPDRPSAPPSPLAKASFMALSCDGIVYWGYLANDGSKWHLLHFPLRGYSQTFPTESSAQTGAYPSNSSTNTAFALNTPCITRANFVFTSNTSARIALVSSTSPNSVSIYDVGVDYKKGELEVTKRPSSILTIPTSPLDAVSFFTQGASPNRSRVSIQSVQDSWNSGHDSLFQQYTGPSLSSPRMGFSGGAPPLQTSTTSGGQPTTPKTPSDGNVLGGNLTQIKDESPVWHSVHVDHEPQNAIQHIAFDPYDSSTLYLVWHKFRRNQTGFERCSYLHRWHALSQPLKVKCSLDLSKYMVSSEAEQTHNQSEEQAPQPNDGFNTSVADFDDSLAHENDEYNNIDLWGFDTKSSKNQRNGTLASTSTNSSHLDDPNSENINNLYLGERKLNEDGNANSSAASMRPTNLVTETWECVSRTVILANSQILNPQHSTNSSSSILGHSRSAHTGNSSNLSSSSETAATKGSQFGQTGHSSNSGPSGPSSANTASSSSQSNTNTQPISKFDSVTHMRIGRNIICMTMASGSTLILDSETFDIVVDYSTPHVWADSNSTQPSGASQNNTIPNSASSTAPSSSSATVPIPTKANAKKRSLDSVQLSPGAQWGLEMTTSPFSPQQPAFSSYDAFLAPSPISGNTSYSSLPPNKRSKRSENTTFDISSLHVTRGPSSWIPTTSGYHTVVSSNFPIAGCISPNQACFAVLFSDLSVRVFHLAPLLRYRTSVLTSQQLCIQVANLFEVSMLKRCTFWDIAAMFLALPEDVYHEQHLHRGVLILLARDIERIEPKSGATSVFWRTNFELIKSSIYRSSPDMNYNFMLSQSMLSLRRTIFLLNSTYRCAPYFRKLLESPTLDHPELGVLFSKTHDFTQDTTRLERETIAIASPLAALKWVQAFTNWSMIMIEAFQKKAARHRIQSSEQNNQSQASGPSSFIADDAGFLSTSQQLMSQHSNSVVATPASGSHMGAQTPNSIHTPGGFVTTPSGPIAHTPVSANRMFESPHGGGSTSSRTGTPAATTQVMTPKTRSSGGPGPTASLIALPEWYSQLPIVPETLEELLMILPDRNVDIGLLWSLDAPLLNLMKEALLYFAVAIHVDKMHPNGKEYLKQFPQPSFTTLHGLLHSQAMTLAHHSIKFITEDWITDQVMPALYAMNEVQARNLMQDTSPLDLTPPRQRFLEFNFFHGHPLDPSTFPTHNGKTLTEVTNDSKTFWHSTSTATAPYLTPDAASLLEVKGEFCKKCTVCNRTSSVSPRHTSDGVSLFVNACPICQAPWMIIRNPQAPSHR